MIAISYLYRPELKFNLGLFGTEREAREWLIQNLVDTKIITCWYDDTKGISAEDIASVSKVFKHFYDLPTLVNYCCDGKLVVIMETK